MRLPRKGGGKRAAGSDQAGDDGGGDGPCGPSSPCARAAEWCRPPGPGKAGAHRQRRRAFCKASRAFGLQIPGVGFGSRRCNRKAGELQAGRWAGRCFAPKGAIALLFFSSFLSVVVSDDGDDDGVGAAGRLPGFLLLAGRLVPGAAAAGRAVRALVLAPRAGRAGRAELLQPGAAFGPGLPGAHEQRALPAGRGPGQVRPPGPLRDPAGHPVLGRARRPGRLLLPLPTPAAPPRGLPHPHPPPRLGRARLRPRAALRARPRRIPLRRPPRPAARGGRQPRASPPAPRMDPGGVSRATGGGATLDEV